MFVQVEVIRMKDVSNAKHHIGVEATKTKKRKMDISCVLSILLSSEMIQVIVSHF